MATTTCYRHPKRTTGASCTRCGKPICPDCMVEAPVGHHCPDCVRSEARRVRRPFAFAKGNGFVVRALIAANVVVFLWQQSNRTVTGRFADAPLRTAQHGEYYRMLTGAFLHAGLLHIAFNMLCLWMLGVALEGAVGRVRFLAIYLAAAFGGSVCSYWLSNPRISGVGASGAVFGVFGAYFVIARARRADTSQVVGLIVVNLLIGIATPGIDNWAHLGGLLTGGLLAAGFDVSARSEGWTKVVLQVVAFVSVVGVLIALTNVRTDRILAG